MTASDKSFTVGNGSNVQVWRWHNGLRIAWYVWVYPTGFGFISARLQLKTERNSNTGGKWTVYCLACDAIFICPMVAAIPLISQIL